MEKKKGSFGLMTTTKKKSQFQHTKKSPIFMSVKREKSSAGKGMKGSCASGGKRTFRKLKKWCVLKECRSQKRGRSLNKGFSTFRKRKRYSENRKKVRRGLLRGKTTNLNLFGKKVYFFGQGK